MVCIGCTNGIFTVANCAGAFTYFKYVKAPAQLGEPPTQEKFSCVGGSLNLYLQVPSTAMLHRPWPETSDNSTLLALELR